LETVPTTQGRNSRHGRGFDLAEHRYWLLLEFAGSVGPGVIEVALITLAIVQREIVFG
jgi:hypothetical protein